MQNYIPYCQIHSIQWFCTSQLLSVTRDIILFECILEQYIWLVIWLVNQSTGQLLGQPSVESKLPSIHPKQGYYCLHSTELKEEYEDQSGSKTVSYSKCLKYTVYIHRNDHLKFSQNFLEAIKKIELSDTIYEEDAAARKLLDHYGTHYAQEVHMGSALTIEKTFDQKLTAVHSEQETDQCVESSGMEFNSNSNSSYLDYILS